MADKLPTFGFKLRGVKAHVNDGHFALRNR